MRRTKSASMDNIWKSKERISRAQGSHRDTPPGSEETKGLPCGHVNRENRWSVPMGAIRIEQILRPMEWVPRANKGSQEVRSREKSEAREERFDGQHLRKQRENITGDKSRAGIHLPDQEKQKGPPCRHVNDENLPHESREIRDSSCGYEKRESALRMWRV